MPGVAAPEPESAGVSKRTVECANKRINLNITAEQHLKLRRYALERNMTVSDILREYINSL